MRTPSLSLLSCMIAGLLLLGPQSLGQGSSPAPPLQQLPPQPAQLSPAAAYAQALHPLEMTRHNIANWSDVELAAMNVAIAEAKAACIARKPDDYTGSDLVELARLCSLGQQWPAVLEAASRYIASPVLPKPLLPDAFIAQTEANLRLKQEPAALASALAMLGAVSYNGDVGDAVDETLDYMRFVHTSDALTLARARQPLLLAAITGVPAPPEATPAAKSAAAPAANPSANPAGNPASPAARLPGQRPISALYAQGLLLPALQQLAAAPEDARRSALILEQALPAALTSDDTLLIARARQQYALLGKPLTGVTPLTSLSMPTETLPALPAPGAITVMLLFPDWCAGCIALGPRLPSTVFTVEGHSAYVYALLAETVPSRKPDPGLPHPPFSPAYAASMLAETPTVTVPVSTLAHFQAQDFPLLLLTDARGVLRVLQPIGPQDLQPGGDVDAAIALVGRNFSPALPSPAPSPAPATPPAR